jgi:hypothetical protein
VIQPLGFGPQVDLDVSQQFSVGQLRKGHREKLVYICEILDLVIAPVLGHVPPKCAQQQECLELKENELTLVRGDRLRADAKDHKSWSQISNRDQTEMPKHQGASLTYDVRV